MPRAPGADLDAVDVLWPDDEALAVRLEAATLGEYTIEGLIGRGGMATVYLAREVALDRPVAIKVMAPYLMRSPGMVERFKREARVAAGLSHPNIIPIHSVRESGPLVCLVMKRLTGRSLDAILREHHALSLPVAQLILRDVAAGLEYAHQHGVIHRDVKPGNLLVDENGAVVVTDFGIAKAREAEALTASGSTIGTPAYMSPEQAMGRRATAASDQYSLGVVAYELLAGEMPFVSESAMGLMYQHTHTPPGPLQLVRPDLPLEVAEAVLRMLAKSPEDRFPTLTDASRSFGTPASLGALDDPVRKELARLAGQTAVPKRRASTPTDRRSGPTSRSGAGPNATTQMMGVFGRRRWPVGLGLLATLGIAAILLARYRPAPTGPVTSLSDTTAPGTPAVPTSQPSASPRAEKPTVRSAIERYRRAVESRDIALVIAAYPAMGGEQVATYRDFFRKSSQIRFEVIIKDLEQKDGEARMRLEGFLRHRDRATGVDHITTYGTRARLVDGPTGWRIMEIK
ncbi:MAG: serine/threonine-protein kinase [Gemmatimonadales bacterium]